MFTIISDSGSVPCACACASVCARAYIFCFILTFFECKLYGCNALQNRNNFEYHTQSSIWRSNKIKYLHWYRIRTSYFNCILQIRELINSSCNWNNRKKSISRLYTKCSFIFPVLYLCDSDLAIFIDLVNFLSLIKR